MTCNISIFQSCKDSRRKFTLKKKAPYSEKLAFDQRTQLSK